MIRRWLSVVTTLAVVAGVTGCGIPNETGVRVDGPQTTSLSGPVNVQRSGPPLRGATEDPEEFVQNFLAAAAGEPDRAYERVRNFVAHDSRRALPTKSATEVVLTLVQVPDDADEYDTEGPADGVTRVTVPLRTVGLLRADGTVTPAPDGSPGTYTFQVGRIQPEGIGKAELGLFLFNPPDRLMLSTRALNDYYEKHTVYFWSTDNSTLVPDQRYLSSSVPTERRATEIARWLNGGPPEWLNPAVRRLPVQLTGNVAETDGRLEINLSGPLDEDAALDRLATQIAWSMPTTSRSAELRIRNETRKSFDVRTQRNAAPLYGVSERERRFVVYGGQVRPLDGPDAPIAPSANQGVVSAGMLHSGAKVAVALTKSVNGRQRLFAGIGAGLVDPANGSQPYGSMSRPVWLRGADRDRPTGLLVAAGKLYRFDVDAHLTEVRVPETSGPVAAVGAALDGRRIAVVVGGVLYVAAVNTDGGGLTVGEPRRVPTSLTAATAVDWIKEDALVVAGTGSGNRPTIAEVSTDGSSEIPLRQPGAPVTHLAAYPENPVFSYSISRLMYEAGGGGTSWANKVNEYPQIMPADVGGPPIDGNAGNPRAPFYLY